MSDNVGALRLRTRISRESRCSLGLPKNSAGYLVPGLCTVLDVGCGPGRCPASLGSCRGLRDVEQPAWPAPRPSCTRLS